MEMELDSLDEVLDLTICSLWRTHEDFPVVRVSLECRLQSQGSVMTEFQFNLYELRR